ncbi:MAG: outer membrane protein assembly factor BamA [wastewater metagenome]|nr:outer membrane protein assembly factor BamA [Candidatus Loosdrechtia aerotolerans]
MMKYRTLLLGTSVFLLLAMTCCFVYVKFLCAETAEKISQVIKQIEIKGNQRISTAAIRSSIRVKEGDLYDPKLINQDVDAIWSMGFFDNIEVELEEIAGGLKLIFFVSEREIIDEIRFLGNEKIKTKKLKDLIELKEGDYLKRYLLKLDEDKIREFYIKKNYPKIEVRAESKTVDGKNIVIFNILEGPRIRIAKIRFVGNKNFKRRKLLKQMETRQKRFPTFIFPGRFNEEEFESDIVKLKEFYMNNGWLDVDVGWEISYEDENRMHITIHVNEGERYYVKDLEIRGAQLFTEEEIKEKLKLLEGGPFFLDALEKDTYQIRLLYGEQGYIGTRVEEKHTFGSEGAEVYITFTIDEKERYYIEKIKVVGNDKTRDNVIRRQLTFYPGEKLDTEKIRDSQRRLTNTGYFDMESGMPVGINFEPGTEPYNQNIIVEVKEGRTGMLRFGGGYGANIGAFGDISYTDRNFDISDLPKSWNDFLQGNAFRGAGQILTLRFSPGFERTEILASLTDPFIFDSPYSVGLSLFNYLRWYTEYEQQTIGSRVSVGREISKDFFVRLIPEFNVIDIDRRDDEREDTPQAVLDAEGSHLKAGITLSAMINRTDNIFAPAEGYEGESSLEFAGLDVDIVKYKFQLTKFRTLFEVPRWGKHVLAYGGTLGIVESLTGEDVPIFERFFAGGYGSLRGFDFRGVSPVDRGTGDQIGGNILMLINTEYLIPIYQDVVRAAVFVDSGKVDRAVRDINFDRFRVSAGVGLRLSIPFLGRSTISIDYGIPIIKEDEDDTESFSFNFGGGSSF